MTPLPDHIPGYGKVTPHTGRIATLFPAKQPRAPVNTRRTATFQQAIVNARLTDGATLSFHHHLRNGDQVMHMVLTACRDAGLRDLHIAPSSLFPCHAALIPFLQDGTITRITTSYMIGPLADAVRAGALKHPAVLQTHGGRAYAIESGRLPVNVAFIAAPAIDRAGNLTGAIGPQACGPLGYAMVDAAYAGHVIAVTDHEAEKLPRICIPAQRVDQIVRLDSIGSAAQIVSGTTGRAPSDAGQLIAAQTAQLIAASGLLCDGFSFQTGAGGTSLAVAKAIGPLMSERGITGDFTAGGITAAHVEMLRGGLFRQIWDVQAFDLDAVASYRDDPLHHAMSASDYASPARPNAIANRLDVMILGAAEIDTDFNVNVTQASDGRIIGGSGGHADTAACAKLPIVTTTLTAGGYPKIVRDLTCLTTPGTNIGAVVTESGIAIHPERAELAKGARSAGLPVTDIDTLRQRAETLCPPRPQMPASGRIVAICEYRDGSVLDVIRADT